MRTHDLSRGIRIGIILLLGQVVAGLPIAGATRPDEIARLLFDGPYFIEIHSLDGLDQLAAQLLTVAANDDGAIKRGLRVAQRRLDRVTEYDAHQVRAWDWNFMLLLRIMFTSERGPYREWRIGTETLLPTEAFEKTLGSPDTEVEYSLPVRVNENGRIEIVMFHDGFFSGVPARWDFVEEFEWCLKNRPQRIIDWNKQRPPDAVPVSPAGRGPE